MPLLIHSFFTYGTHYVYWLSTQLKFNFKQALSSQCSLSRYLPMSFRGNALILCSARYAREYFFLEKILN
jgi:hypothetical protein